MKECKKILKIIEHPSLILYYFDKFGIKRISDKKFLEYKYFFVLNKKLDLENPQTFNEKLQWLKLYDRNPEYTKMVDKCEAKKYVANVIGEEYIIPTLGIYNSFEEIDFQKLPNQFVMKCTHDCGSIIICKDKSKFNMEKAKNKINKALKYNYYYAGREWPYKNIKPRIIIESFMDDGVNSQLVDYKLQCFWGKVDNILVCVDRDKETGVKYHYFDTNWKYLKYCPYPGINEKNINISKPKQLDKMIKIAERLSAGIPEVRIDLYIIHGKIYFGEYTFFTNGGFDTTITSDADIILGEKLKLPIKREK